MKGEERKPSSSKKYGGRKGGRGGGQGDTKEDSVKSSLQKKFMNLDDVSYCYVQKGIILLLQIATELTKSFPDCPVGFLLDVAAKIERYILCTYNTFLSKGNIGSTFFKYCVNL